MTKPPVHLSHDSIVKRLKRAEGHLHTIIGMLEKQRTCLEIAQQLHAVERAISVAKKVLIHDHIDHCLEAATAKPSKGGLPGLQEFKDITKYL